MNAAQRFQRGSLLIDQLSNRWLFAALICFTALVAVPLLLTTLAPYDDEGYIMMTLKSFGEGKSLYQETYTQYGPAFYLITEPLHSALGLPFTQHAIRFKTLVLWILPVLLSMGIVHRLSGNRMFAFFTSCMVAIHLSRFALEPGHPQEISLLMGMLALWFVCDSSLKRWWFAGACAAFCGLCKINVGFALTMPLLLAASSVMPSTRFWRMPIMVVIWVAVTLVIGGTMLPWNLGKTSFACAVVMLSSWLAVSAVSIRSTRTAGEPKAFGTVIVSGFVVSLAIVVWCWLNGTSFAMLAWGMVGQHSGLVKSFFQPIAVDWFSIFASLIIAACYRNRQAIGMASFVCLFVAVLKSASTVISPLTFQIQSASEFLAMVGPCFAPALLLYRNRIYRGRVMLSAMAAIGPWIAFPVPGTQLMLGTIPAWMALAVVAQDYAQWFACSKEAFAEPATSKKRTRPCMEILVATAVVVGFVSSSIAWFRWSNGQSLAIRGSEWLHLESKQVALQQEIVQEIKKSGATHLVFDGHTNGRFYFWTNLKPLTSANATIWPYLLSQSELNTLRQAVEQSPALCVVVPPGIPRPISDSNTMESRTRQSLYEGTVFHFKHPSGWAIGSRLR